MVASTTRGRVDAVAMHAVDGQGRDRHRRRARVSARASPCTSARVARRSSSRSGSPTLMESTCAELDGLGVENLGVVLRHAGAGRDRRDGRRDGRALRPRRRPHQQRPDVPAAGADRRGRRGRRRRLLHVRGQGHALGDAGGVPAHARPGLGAHRELRVVDGDHRRQRLRGVQRVEGGDPRARPAPRRASGAPTASS